MFCIDEWLLTTNRINMIRTFLSTNLLLLIMINRWCIYLVGCGRKPTRHGLGTVYRRTNNSFVGPPPNVWTRSYKGHIEGIRYIPEDDDDEEDDDEEDDKTMLGRLGRTSSASDRKRRSSRFKASSRSDWSNRSEDSLVLIEDESTPKTIENLVAVVTANEERCSCGVWSAMACAWQLERSLIVVIALHRRHTWLSSSQFWLLYQQIPSCLYSSGCSISRFQVILIQLFLEFSLDQ